MHMLTLQWVVDRLGNLLVIMNTVGGPSTGRQTSHPPYTHITLGARSLGGPSSYHAYAYIIVGGPLNGQWLTDQ